MSQEEADVHRTIFAFKSFFFLIYLFIGTHSLLSMFFSIIQFNSSRTATIYVFSCFPNSFLKSVSLCIKKIYIYIFVGVCELGPMKKLDKIKTIFFDKKKHLFLRMIFFFFFLFKEGSKTVSAPSTNKENKTYRLDIWSSGTISSFDLHP